MQFDEDNLMATLDTIHRDLSWARGAARARRDSNRTRAAAPGPWMTGRDFGSGSRPWVDNVQRLLAEQIPPAAIAAWESISDLPAVEEDSLVTPVRLGTVRVGIGLGLAADVPVIVPLLAGSHVVINSPNPVATGPVGQFHADEVSAIVGSLVLRVLVTTRLGSVLFIGDGWLPEFLDRDVLYDNRLVFNVDPELPGHLDNLLINIKRDIERIQGTPPDVRRLLVLSGLGYYLTGTRLEELHWILRSGPACGVHAILVDTPVPQDVPAEIVYVSHNGVRVSTSGPLLDVRADSVPVPGTAVMEAVDRLLTVLRPPALSATELCPETFWTESSQFGLHADVGDVDGRPATLRLGDAPPHALVGGPSGSGKTNLIYGLIAGLAARYSPDELELYLLDFKEGVSFAPFAPGRKDPSWLPHARLVGLNINDDREFGLALLRYLRAQLRLRATMAKQYEVTDLAALRSADPHGRWPRMVTVIDEFQVLVSGRDKITEEAVALLEDLARRGRSFGIHLVLASQDVSAIEALWGRPALVAQLTLRIALPKAVRVLADDNPEAVRLAEHHVVINSESGVVNANQIVRMPRFDPEFLDGLRRRLWGDRDPSWPVPVVFDGDVTPQLSTARDYQALTIASVPVAIVGRSVDVDDRAAMVKLNRAPGRTIVVIGSRVTEACDVLTASTLSLARQHAPGTTEFTLVAVGEGSHVTAAEALHSALTVDGHSSSLIDHRSLAATIAGLASAAEAALTGDRRPSSHYLVFFAVDAAAAWLRATNPETGRSGHEELQRIMGWGPENGLHTIGWWRTSRRMKDDLGGFATQLDEVGSWIALDVQGEDLAVLPGGQMVTWHPRLRRGLWFDKAMHDQPHLVIPYATALSLEEDTS
jgi:FtsK/SpoIIIE family